MRIILGELKKIWSLQMVIIVTVLSALFYLMFMEFYITYFPNGHPQTELFDFSVELTKKYGTTLEQAEFDEFISARKALVSEAEMYIKEITAFAESGIFSFEDYSELAKKVYESNEATEEENEVYWILLSEDCNFVGFRLQELDNIADFYDNAAVSYQTQILHSDNAREAKRLSEILESGQYTSIMPENVISNANIYGRWLAILTVLSMLVFLSPLLTGDMMRGVNLLQYSSKHGRKILSSQLAATMISAFLLVTIELVIFGAIYRLTGTQVFLKNGMNSFIGFYDFWFDMTYKQYLFSNLGMIYMCALSAALLAFVLSKVSRDYISLTLKLIPLFVLFIFLCTGSIDYNFTMTNPLYRMTGIIGVEPMVCGTVIILGISFCLLVIIREKKVDIQ